MSNRGMPSIIALLGLLGLAGYQNRDKIGEMLKGVRQDKDGRPGNDEPDGGIGGVLSGGLGELLDRFKQAGQGETAESWVKRGPNQPLSPEQLENAVGGEVLTTLSSQTGLSREELLDRLTRNLPEAVDKFTPEGRLPSADEAARFA